MADYTQHVRTRTKQGASTPQSAPVPGREREMRLNDAGGYVFTLDPWKQLERFLILGTDGGTYYTGERELTKRNAAMIAALLKLDGVRVVNTIAVIAAARRAPKQSPALFALGMAAKLGDDATRRAAFAAAETVCGTLSTLKEFIRACAAFGGWSHGQRRFVQRWLRAREPRDLVYQLAKYGSRAGWSNKDLFRVAHFAPVNIVERVVTDWVFDVTGGRTEAPPGTPANDARLRVFEQAAVVGAPYAQLRTVVELALDPEVGEAKLVDLIQRYRLTREMIPTEKLTPGVWEALLDQMPMTAMIRNLATMSRNGLLGPLSESAKTVVARLTDTDRLRKAKLHPVQLLLALKTYERGHSVAHATRGAYGRFTGSTPGKTWTPNPQVVQALNDAFYGAFQFVEPTGKATLVAVDVSVSMGVPVGGDSGLMCHEAAAAMAMAVVRTEPNWAVMTFDTQPHFVTITPSMNLADVTRRISESGGGGTDCSVPFDWARQQKLKVEAFVSCTDSETWAGKSHPHQALERYRRDSGLPALSVNLAFTATEGALGDPTDTRLLEAVGFDATIPTIVADFIRSGGL